MDKKLYTIVKEAFPQIDLLNKKFIAYESSIQGVLFWDGKDISEMIKNRDYSFLLAEDAKKLFSDQVDCNVTPSMLEQIANSIKSYPNDVLDYISCFITLVRKVNTSLDELIPSSLDEEGKEMAKYIEETSTTLSKFSAICEEAIQATLKNIIEQEQPEDEAQASMRLMGAKFVSFSLVHYLIGLSFIAISCIHFHQVVYEYYYGAKHQKIENTDMIKQIVSDINLFLTPQLTNINKNIEQTVKTVEHIRKNAETTINTLNEIKENQSETNKLIENRNDAEKPKRLQIAKCAKDICRILKNEYKMIIKQDTIEKYLHRFDDDLEMGNKIALPSYEHAMYFDKNNFIVWCRETFIPYYLEHRRIRVKNKTPRRSSSDAAFDEAAQEKYNDEEEGDDNY